MTYGLPEAKLAENLEGFESALPSFIKLAYLPSSGIIKLRLTATGNERDYLKKAVDSEVEKLKIIIPDIIFSFEDEPFEAVIGRLLAEKGKSICTAESCTGGNIAHLITSVAGSSRYYKGTVVAYDNTVKTDLLGVPQPVIEKHGAVSGEVARLMAEGARSIMKADFSIATTGIAGPDGGTPGKPVGTVFIAAASERGTIAEKYVYGNDRNINISRFTISALNLILREIRKEY